MSTHLPTRRDLIEARMLAKKPTSETVEQATRAFLAKGGRIRKQPAETVYGAPRGIAWVNHKSGIHTDGRYNIDQTVGV